MTTHQPDERDDLAALQRRRRRGDGRLRPTSAIAASRLTCAANAWLHPPAAELCEQRYGKLVKRLGIETSIHKLRHYSATELIAAGVDVRTVVGRLGHGGGGTTTLCTYAARYRFAA
jgi:integrase